MSNATASGRATFFKQSGWMTLAAMLGGLFNMVSNFVAQGMEPGQFNIFDTALAALGILTIPSLGMQAAFAAQAAGTADEERQRELAATMRFALLLLGGLWLVVVAWCILRQPAIMAAYKLTEPAMLWVLLLIVLVNLVTPIPNGIIQGRQDFFWFGWAILLNGAFRLGVLWVVVWNLKQGALGALIGFLTGGIAVLAIVSWRTGDLLFSFRGTRPPWGAWIRRLIPVTIGLGALSLLMLMDGLFVREMLFDRLTDVERDGFSAVRKIGQALVFVVGALTSVMYPKVARSFQHSQKSDVLMLTLLLTGGIAVCGATLATFLPELPMMISPAKLRGSKVLVPAYCWALVPLALSYVLVWNLLARECYRAVPWMAASAIGCWFCLQAYGTSVPRVIQIVGLFNAGLFVACAIFAWLERGRQTAGRGL